MAAKFATLGIGTKGYVRSHWHGQHSLILSFWVNLALLRAAIFVLEGFILTPLVVDATTGAISALLFFILADVIIYIWQVVGVLRACDRYQSAYGSVSVVWAIHFGILMSLIFTVVGVFTSVQNAFLERDQELLRTLLEQERTTEYALTLSGDGAVLTLKGSFDFGITKAVTAFLEAHPNVKAIVLASPGGNTYEGRGVAKTVRDRGLDSYVFAECFSACTLAFIAGTTRTLGPNGKLGFHQYGMDADYQVAFVDIEGEQNTDREFFRSQKIEDAFLERVFEASQSDLWIPSTNELLVAGVVHRVSTEVIED
jgi:hypothetical protein